MQIKFKNQKDLIDFLLEIYMKDKEFETWDCTKFNLDHDKLNVHANTEFYEAYKDTKIKKIIKFGNNNINTNCFLYLLQTNDINGKIKNNFLAQSILNLNNNQKRYYLKEIFEEFINKYRNFNFDIKLRYPNNLKKVFDKNNEYDSFNINFFSNGLQDNYIIFSYNENQKNVSNDPPMLWTSYCYNLYLTYLENKKNINKSL